MKTMSNVGAQPLHGGVGHHGRVAVLADLQHPTGERLALQRTQRGQQQEKETEFSHRLFGVIIVVVRERVADRQDNPADKVEPEAQRPA